VVLPVNVVIRPSNFQLPLIIDFFRPPSASVACSSATAGDFKIHVDNVAESVADLRALYRPSPHLATILRNRSGHTLDMLTTCDLVLDVVVVCHSISQTTVLCHS